MIEVRVLEKKNGFLLAAKFKYDCPDGGEIFAACVAVNRHHKHWIPVSDILKCRSWGMREYQVSFFDWYCPSLCGYVGRKLSMDDLLWLGVSSAYDNFQPTWEAAFAECERIWALLEEPKDNP